jgi:hypothetical protein
VWNYQIKFLFTKGLNVPLLEAVHFRVRGAGWQEWRVALCFVRDIVGSH